MMLGAGWLATLPHRQFHVIDYKIIMAKTIKTWGYCPVWGLQHPELTDVGSGEQEQVLFATNISWTNNTSEYQQLNHKGQVQGIMLYDATLDWSLSANISHEYEDTFQNFYAPAMEMVLSNSIGRHLLESDKGFGYDPDDAVSVLKTINITQTNDGPATLDLQGTIFYLGGEGE